MQYFPWVYLLIYNYISEACFHLDNVGIVIHAKDIEIWNYALGNNLFIVTNDNDFLDLAEVKRFLPKVVLLRTGNQNNNFIEEISIRHKTDIDLLNKSDGYDFLENILSKMVHRIPSDLLP